MTNNQKLVQLEEFLKSAIEEENNLRKRILKLEDQDQEKSELVKRHSSNTLAQKKFSLEYDVLKKKMDSGAVRSDDKYNG